MEAAAAEIAQRHAENQQLAAQLVELGSARNAGEARDGLLQFESEQVRARLTEIEELLRSTRQQLDQARDRRGELAATAAKLQSDLQHLADTCLNELGIERPVLMAETIANNSADTAIPLLTGDELAAEDQAHREMRA